jgi:hypothetical protein
LLKSAAMSKPALLLIGSTLLLLGCGDNNPCGQSVAQFCVEQHVPCNWSEFPQQCGLVWRTSTTDMCHGYHAAELLGTDDGYILFFDVTTGDLVAVNHDGIAGGPNHLTCAAGPKAGFPPFDCYDRPQMPVCPNGPPADLRFELTDMAAIPDSMPSD